MSLECQFPENDYDESNHLEEGKHNDYILVDEGGNSHKRREDYPSESRGDYSKEITGNRFEKYSGSNRQSNWRIAPRGTRYKRGRPFHRGSYRSTGYYRGKGRPLFTKHHSNRMRQLSGQENEIPSDSLDKTYDSRSQSTEQSLSHRSKSRERSVPRAYRSNSQSPNSSHRSQYNRNSRSPNSSHRSSQYNRNSHSPNSSHRSLYNKNSQSPNSAHRCQYNRNSRSPNSSHRSQYSRNSRSPVLKRRSSNHSCYSQRKRISKSRDRSDSRSPRYYSKERKRSRRSHSGGRSRPFSPCQDNKVKRYKKDYSHRERHNHRQSSELCQQFESSNNYTPNTVKHHRSFSPSDNQNTIGNSLGNDNRFRRIKERTEENRKSENYSDGENLVSEGMQEIKLGTNDNLSRNQQNIYNQDLRHRIMHNSLTYRDIECLHRKNDRYHYYRDPNKSSESVSSGDTSLFDTSSKSLSTKSSSNVLNLVKGISEVCKMHITADGKRSFTNFKEDDPKQHEVKKPRLDDTVNREQFKSLNNLAVHSCQNKHSGNELVHGTIQWNSSNNDALKSGDIDKHVQFNACMMTGQHDKEVLVCNTSLNQTALGTDVQLKNDMEFRRNRSVDKTLPPKIQKTTMPLESEDVQTESVPYFTNISKEKKLLNKFNSRKKPLLPTPKLSSTNNSYSTNISSTSKFGNNSHFTPMQKLPCPDASDIDSQFTQKQSVDLPENLPSKEQLDSAIHWFWEKNSVGWNLSGGSSSSDENLRKTSNCGSMDAPYNYNKPNISHSSLNKQDTPEQSQYKKIQSDGQCLYVPTNLSDITDKSDTNVSVGPKKKLLKSSSCDYIHVNHLKNEYKRKRHSSGREDKLDSMQLVDLKPLNGDNNNNVQIVQKGHHKQSKTNEPADSEKIVDSSKQIPHSGSQNKHKQNSQTRTNIESQKITPDKDKQIVSVEPTRMISVDSSKDINTNNNDSAVSPRCTDSSKDGDTNVDDLSVSSMKNKLTSTPVPHRRTISCDEDLLLSPVEKTQTSIKSGSKEKDSDKPKCTVTSVTESDCTGKPRCTVTSETEIDCSTDSMVVVDSWQEQSSSSMNNSSHVDNVQSNSDSKVGPTSVENQHSNTEQSQEVKSSKAQKSSDTKTEIEKTQNISVKTKESEKKTRSPIKVSSKKKLKSIERKAKLKVVTKDLTKKIKTKDKDKPLDESKSKQCHDLSNKTKDNKSVNVLNTDGERSHDMKATAPVKSLFGRKIRTGLEDYSLLKTQQKEKSESNSNVSTVIRKSSQISVPEKTLKNNVKDVTKHNKQMKSKNVQNSNKTDKVSDQKVDSIKKHDAIVSGVPEVKKNDSVRGNKTLVVKSENNSKCQKDSEEGKIKEMKKTNVLSKDKNKQADSDKNVSNRNKEKQSKLCTSEMFNSKDSVKTMYKKQCVQKIKNKNEQSLKFKEPIDKVVVQNNCHTESNNKPASTNEETQRSDNTQDNQNNSLLITENKDKVVNQIKDNSLIDENVDYKAESTMNYDEANDSFDCVGIIENVDLSTVSVLSADEIERLENVQDVEVTENPIYSSGICTVSEMECQGPEMLEEVEIETTPDKACVNVEQVDKSAVNELVSTNEEEGTSIVLNIVENSVKGHMENVCNQCDKETDNSKIQLANSKECNSLQVMNAFNNLEMKENINNDNVDISSKELKSQSNIDDDLDCVPSNIENVHCDQKDSTQTASNACNGTTKPICELSPIVSNGDTDRICEITSVSNDSANPMCELSTSISNGTTRHICEISMSVSNGTTKPICELSTSVSKSTTKPICEISTSVTNNTSKPLCELSTGVSNDLTQNECELSTIVKPIESSNTIIAKKTPCTKLGSSRNSSVVLPVKINKSSAKESNSQKESARVHVLRNWKLTAKMSPRKHKIGPNNVTSHASQSVHQNSKSLMRLSTSSDKSYAKPVENSQGLKDGKFKTVQKSKDIIMDISETVKESLESKENMDTVNTADTFSLESETSNKLLKQTCDLQCPIEENMNKKEQNQSKTVFGSLDQNGTNDQLSELKIVSVCGNAEFDLSVNYDEDCRLKVTTDKCYASRPVTPSLDNLDIILNRTPLKKIERNVQGDQNGDNVPDGSMKNKSGITVIQMPSLVHTATRTDSLRDIFSPIEENNSATDESELDSSGDKLVIDMSITPNKLMKDNIEMNDILSKELPSEDTDRSEVTEGFPSKDDEDSEATKGQPSIDNDRSEVTGQLSKDDDKNNTTEETLIYSNSDLESSKDKEEYCQNQQNTDVDEEYNDYEEDDDDIQFQWYVNGVPQSPWTPVTPRVKQEMVDAEDNDDDDDEDFKQPPVLPELGEYFRKNPEIFSKIKANSDTSVNNIVPSSQPDSPQMEDTYDYFNTMTDLEEQEFKYEATPIIDDTDSNDSGKSEMKTKEKVNYHSGETNNEEKDISNMNDQIGDANNVCGTQSTKIENRTSKTTNLQESNIGAGNSLRFNMRSEKFQEFRKKMKSLVSNTNTSKNVNETAVEDISDEERSESNAVTTEKEIHAIYNEDFDKNMTENERTSIRNELVTSAKNSENLISNDKEICSENNDSSPSSERASEAVKEQCRQNTSIQQDTQPKVSVIQGTRPKVPIMGSFLFPPSVQNASREINNDTQQQQQQQIQKNSFQVSALMMSEPTKKLLVSLRLFSIKLTNNGTYDFSHFSSIRFTHIKVLADGSSRNTIGEFIPSYLSDQLLRCVKCSGCNSCFSPYRFLKHLCNVQWGRVSERSFENMPMPTEVLRGSAIALWKLMFYVYHMEKHLSKNIKVQNVDELPEEIKRGQYCNERPTESGAEQVTSRQDRHTSQREANQNINQTYTSQREANQNVNSNYTPQREANQNIHQTYITHREANQNVNQNYTSQNLVNQNVSHTFSSQRDVNQNVNHSCTALRVGQHYHLLKQLKTGVQSTNTTHQTSSYIGQTGQSICQPNSNQGNSMPFPLAYTQQSVINTGNLSQQSNMSNGQLFGQTRPGNANQIRSHYQSTNQSVYTTSADQGNNFQLTSQPSQLPFNGSVNYAYYEHLNSQTERRVPNNVSAFNLQPTSTDNTGLIHNPMLGKVYSDVLGTSSNRSHVPLQKTGIQHSHKESSRNVGNVGANNISVAANVQEHISGTHQHAQSSYLWDNRHTPQSSNQQSSSSLSLSVSTSNGIKTPEDTCSPDSMNTLNSGRSLSPETCPSPCINRRPTGMGSSPCVNKSENQRSTGMGSSPITNILDSQRPSVAGQDLVTKSPNSTSKTDSQTVTDISQNLHTPPCVELAEQLHSSHPQSRRSEIRHLPSYNEALKSRQQLDSCDSKVKRKLSVDDSSQDKKVQEANNEISALSVKPVHEGAATSQAQEVTSCSATKGSQIQTKQLQFNNPSDVLKAIRFAQEIQFQAISQLHVYMVKDQEKHEKLQKEFEEEQARRVAAEKKLEQLEKQFGRMLELLNKKT